MTYINRAISDRIGSNFAQKCSVKKAYFVLPLSSFVNFDRVQTLKVPCSGLQMETPQKMLIVQRSEEATDNMPECLTLCQHPALTLVSLVTSLFPFCCCILTCDIKIMWL